MKILIWKKLPWSLPNWENYNVQEEANEPINGKKTETSNQILNLYRVKKRKKREK